MLVAQELKISDLFDAYYEWDYAHHGPPAVLVLNPVWHETYKLRVTDFIHYRIYPWEKFLDAAVRFDPNEPNFHFEA